MGIVLSWTGSVWLDVFLFMVVWMGFGSVAIGIGACYWDDHKKKRESARKDG